MPADRSPAGRNVTLVLVMPTGELIGALPPFDVSSPWWSDAAAVVRGAHEERGVDVTVLRMLAVDGQSPAGGAVTYLAETTHPVPTDKWPATLDDHPLRLPWARPGGPAADMAWVRRALAEQGVGITGSPEQFRTWNLSSLWRVPVRQETLWFKTVPPFLEHEGAILELLRADPDVRVPRLVAHEGRRVLLHEIPGEDLYAAPLASQTRMVSQLVSLQRRWMGRVSELLAIGLADLRAQALTAAIRDLIDRLAPQTSADDAAALHAFAVGLPDRFAAISTCKLPDTLVHGDFHQGNHRGDPVAPVLFDWGDSAVGSPAPRRAGFHATSAG